MPTFLADFRERWETASAFKTEDFRHFKQLEVLKWFARHVAAHGTRPDCVSMGELIDAAKIVTEKESG